MMCCLHTHNIFSCISHVSLFIYFNQVQQLYSRPKAVIQSRGTKQKPCPLTSNPHEPAQVSSVPHSSKYSLISVVKSALRRALLYNYGTCDDSYFFYLSLTLCFTLCFISLHYVHDPIVILVMVIIIQ